MRTGLAVCFVVAVIALLLPFFWPIAVMAVGGHKVGRYIYNGGYGPDYEDPIFFASVLAGALLEAVWLTGAVFLLSST